MTDDRGPSSDSMALEANRLIAQEYQQLKELHAKLFQLLGDSIETAEPIQAAPVTVNGTLRGPERDVFRVQLQQFMERYPIILGAPFCVTAFEHGAVEVGIDGKKFPLFSANWPALWVNCAGLSGAVVPAGKDRDGLPIGLQIVGRAFGEEAVLAVAKAAENALGGFKRPPL